MTKNKESGYVGLIILLISSAVIGLIFAFTVLAPDTNSDTQESIGRTDIDKAESTIEYGKEAEHTINSYNDSLVDDIREFDNM